MAQAISFQPLITEYRLQSQANPWGINGRQSGFETGFPPSIFVSPDNTIQPMLHTL